MDRRPTRWRPAPTGDASPRRRRRRSGSDGIGVAHMIVSAIIVGVVLAIGLSMPSRSLDFLLAYFGFR